MKILAIETSCDETSAAVVEKKGDEIKIISNIVASSGKLQNEYGGILPTAAAREQLKFVIPVISEAINHIKVESIDALAVTVGPGLIGSLLVGVETAKTLSFFWQKPLIPVNHLLGHIYSAWIGAKKTPRFPVLGLIASGGHTELVFMPDHGNYQVVGRTRDDACGEAFDKIARFLGLPYPGGPALEILAKKSVNPVKLPRPMQNSQDLDFSFSGLKTAAVNLLKAGRSDEAFKKDLALGVQDSIVDVLISKTVKAVKTFQPKTIVAGGGVLANQALRKKLKGLEKTLKIAVVLSPKIFCADNAAVIATAAIFNQQPISWRNINASANLPLV